MSKQLKPLSQEELQALSEELNNVLIKHNAEMSVASTISLMKVVDESDSTEETEKESDTEAA